MILPEQAFLPSFNGYKHAKREEPPFIPLLIHVEQKNCSHVRQLLGCDRLDQHELIPLINDLYAIEWSLYRNHFCPTIKLVEKTRINSGYRKKHDKHKTLYQRIMGSEWIDEQTKQQLKSVHLALYHFKLKAETETTNQTDFQSRQSHLKCEGKRALCSCVSVQPGGECKIRRNAGRTAAPAGKPQHLMVAAPQPNAQASTT